MRTLFFAFCLVAIPAMANATCWQSTPESTPLHQGWHEHVTDTGVLNDGRLLRVYQNTETGTWSITVIDPTGRECLWTSGEGWKSLRTLVGEKT